MLSNLKLIFIHGINDVATNYSQELYIKVLDCARTMLLRQGKTEEEIDDILSRLVHHEIFWADLTTDLVNRYMQLQYYQKPHPFWSFLTKPIDPLALQIMLYIKDKGDKKTGRMSILQAVDADIKRILSYDDVGKETTAKDGGNAIIVAHSLGSVIAFDYVMGFRKECMLPKEATIKSFITMGSPLPIFTSAMGHPDSDLILPENVHKWVNIISPQDSIARYTKRYFKKIAIDEREVFTGVFPFQAHNDYFKNTATAELIANEALTALGYSLGNKTKM